MRQRSGVQHMEARDKRGRRAVHSVLLCGLHVLRGVQHGDGGGGGVSVNGKTEAITTIPK